MSDSAPELHIVQLKPQRPKEYRRQRIGFRKRRAKYIGRSNVEDLIWLRRR